MIRFTIAALVVINTLLSTPVEYLDLAEYNRIVEAQVPAPPTGAVVNAPNPGGGGEGGSLNCGLASVRCVPSEYATPALCAAVTNAGDICAISGGPYSGWTISRAGTIGSPITFLAVGSVTINSGGVAFNADYNKLVGFTVTGTNNNSSDPTCPSSICTVNIQIADGVDGTEIWNNTFSNFSDGVAVTSSIPGQSHIGTIIVGNTSQGRNPGITVDWFHYSIIGSDTIIQYNTMNESDKDMLLFYGPRARFQNNYGWGPNATPGLAHTDFVQTGVCCSRTIGTEGFTLEANFFVGNPPAPDQHFSNQETSPDNSGNYLSRGNVVHNSASGQGIFEYQSVYILNELYADLNLGNGFGNDVALYIRNSPHSRIFNSLFVQVWDTGDTSTPVFDAAGGTSGYNLGWDKNGGTVTFTGAFGSDANTLRNTNPLFTNYASDIFTLQSGSPVLSNGTAPTTITSGGGSNITSFTVGDAGFFRGFNSNIPQYGGNITDGDIITIGTNVRRISSITGNTITITSPVTASNGTNVFWGDDPTPARGPYPDKATFTITNTLSYSAPTITATINDASIVRRVEFYVNGLPTIMDIDTPFTMSTSGFASGNYTIKAIARPRYASKTLAITDSINITVP